MLAASRSMTDWVNGLDRVPHLWSARLVVFSLGFGV